MFQAARSLKYLVIVKPHSSRYGVMTEEHSLQREAELIRDVQLHENVFLKAKSQSDVKTRLRQVDRAWL